MKILLKTMKDERLKQNIRLLLRRCFCCQSRSLQQTTASLAKLFGYSASIQQIALWRFTVTRFPPVM